MKKKKGNREEDKIRKREKNLEDKEKEKRVNERGRKKWYNRRSVDRGKIR